VAFAAGGSVIGDRDAASKRADRTYEDALKEMSALVRDIFGNPFRPVTIDSACRSPNIAALARTIYEGRAFERIPELADALEEAGCHDDDLLGHCRQPGPHARGCWGVDLILGKS
jgi:hypothetical protein